MKKIHKRPSASKVTTMVEPLENRWLLSTVPGALNSAFAGGVVEGSILDTNDATNLVIQSDGKLVIVGDTSLATGNKEAFASRYNQDGSIDTSFNSTGYNAFNLGASSDVVATAVALQSDGKIVVVGTVGNVSTFTGDFFVARLNTNGTLDTSFNSTGYRIIDFGGLDSAAGVVVNQTSGQIVIAGASVSITTGSGGIAMAFVNPDGSMNTNFGDETGMVVTNPGTGTIEAATSIESIGDDYLVSGFSLNSSTQQSQMLLAEFSSQGRLNRAFGTNGRAFASFGNTVELGVYATYDPTSGLIYEAGASANGAIDLPPGLPSGTATATPTESDFAIASFNADGSLNTSFNGTGEETIDFNSNLDAATSVQVQGDGKIIVAGGSQLSSGRSVTAIARLNPDGTLDTSFAPEPAGSISPQDTSGLPHIVFNPSVQDENGREILDVGDSNGAFHALLYVDSGGLAHIYFVGHNKDTAVAGNYYVADIFTGEIIQRIQASVFSIYPYQDDCVGPPSGTFQFLMSINAPATQSVSVMLNTSTDASTSSLGTGMARLITFNPGVTSQVVSLPYDETNTSAVRGSYRAYLSDPTNAILGVAGASTRIDYVYPNNNLLQPSAVTPIKFPHAILGGGKTAYFTNVQIKNTYVPIEGVPNKKTGGKKSTVGLEKGSIIITIYGSRNQALDTSTDTVLGTLKTNISLKPQQTSKAYKVKLNFPAVTKNTRDYLIAAVTGAGVSTASTDFLSSTSQVEIQKSNVALVAVAGNPTATDSGGGKSTATFSIMNTGSAAAFGKINFAAIVENSNGSPVYYYGPPYGGSARSATINIKPGGTGKASFNFGGLPNSFVPAGNYTISIQLISSTLVVPNTTDGTVIGSIPLVVS